MINSIKSIFFISALIFFLPTGIAAAIVDDECEADWDYDDSGLTVNFTDDSEADEGMIVSWFWEFGDGATSTEQNPEHVYAEGGEYDVCLTIITNEGCSSTECDDIDVEDTGDCEADFAWDDDELTVTFEDNSDGGDGSITSWLWTFGDGTTSSEENPVHIFSVSGTYSTCLSITTSDGCTNTFCDEIEVEGDGGGGTCDAYYAIITMTETDSGTYVIFDNQSTGGMAGGTTPYTWDFGDGSPLYENTEAEHLYTTPGTYMACVTAGVNGDDCFDQYCSEISITVQSTGMDWTEIHSFQIYPNPVNEQFTIDASAFNGMIEIFDLTGKKFISQQLQNNSSIYTGQLPSGTYTVMIRTADAVFTQKMIVQH